MKPEISIVIPFWNKFFEIDLLLKALSLQDIEPARFEVLIVDDGSDRPIDDLITKHAGGPEVRCLRLERTGNRGRNRNRGAEEARGDRLLFLDSDMLPPRHLVSSFERATRMDRKLVALGLRHSLLEYDKRMVDARRVEEEFGIFAALPAMHDERIIAINHKVRTGVSLWGGWQHLYSHSFCVWKEEFQAVGGFDEEYSRNWGAEDIDLGYRLWERGCRFELQEGIVCYHLWHPVNVQQNIRSLKKNYAILLRKHPHWAVELFVKEVETWAIETMNMQEKILRREHLICPAPPDDETLAALPEDVLLMGVEDGALLAHPKVARAFNPHGRLPSEKIENIMGIQTPYPDGRFSLALVSGRYADVNDGLFDLLLREAGRIARRTVVLKDGESLSVPVPEAEGARRARIAAQKKLLIITANDFQSNSKRYFYHGLAVAAHRRGIRTGLQVVYDPCDSIPLNAGFGRMERPEEARILRECQYHTLTILADEIPLIMDSTVAPYNYRGTGNRILWEEMQYEGQELAINAFVLPTYRRVLCPRAGELGRFGALPQDYLPFGVDLGRLDPLAAARDAAGPRPVTVFACVEAAASPYHNLAKLATAFSEAFGTDPGVKLRIFAPRCDFKPPFNEYPNHAMTRLIERTSLYREVLGNREIDAAIAAAEGRPNIEFVHDRLPAESISAGIAAADFLVDCGSRKNISPWVLEAAALGLTPILPDDSRYEGYLREGEAIRYASGRASALYYEEAIEPLFEDERSLLRYYTVADIGVQALAGALREAHGRRKDGRLPAEARRRVREEFDWNRVADALHGLL